MNSDAPMSRSRPQEEQSYSLVLICGLATTGLALLGVHLTRHTEFRIMSYYADYVIPVGALLVGAVAASGYGICSWVTGIKITRGLMWAVLACQLAAYFAAQYVEFTNLKLTHRNGRPVGFLEYYDFTARAFSWKQTDGSRGRPLGVWGYAFRTLEILGFAAGGLIVPMLLSQAPYCADCQRYMRTEQLCQLAASVPFRKIKKSDMAAEAAYEAEQKEALARGSGAWERMKQLAETSQATQFQQAVLDFKASDKGTSRLPRRLIFQLVKCRRCQAGWLQARLLSREGKTLKVTQLPRVNLHPEFVRALATSPAPL